MRRATIAGLLIIGVPVMLLTIIVFWRRQRAIVAFALALMAVGLGYLAATGAAADVARALLGNHRWIQEKPIAAGQGPAGSPQPGKPNL